jgi:zinc D-Ala-D-Ala carboxypeptidase
MTDYRAASPAELEKILRWRWPNVDPAREWASDGGAMVVVPEFLDRFQSLREAMGRPLAITSGYRTPAHNMRVSGTGATGPHTTGRAVDIRVYGEVALRVVELARGLGFTGVGLSQAGPQASRFVHLDDLGPGFAGPRPWIWTY